MAQENIPRWGDIFVILKFVKVYKNKNVYNMKELKQARGWYVGITHFLTSGFVVPIIAGIFLGYIFNLLEIFNQSSLFASIFMGIIGVLIIWGGVIYSAKWIMGRYYISNAKKVVTVSTSIMAVFGLFSIAFGFLGILITGTTILWVIESIFTILGIFVFYSVSKKYIN